MNNVNDDFLLLCILIKTLSNGSIQHDCSIIELDIANQGETILYQLIHIFHINWFYLKVWFWK